MKKTRSILPSRSNDISRAYTGMTSCTPEMAARSGPASAGRYELELNGPLVPSCAIQTSPGSRVISAPTPLHPR